jgi:hypothetical protein
MVGTADTTETPARRAVSQKEAIITSGRIRVLRCNQRATGATSDFTPKKRAMREKTKQSQRNAALKAL